MAPSSFIDIDNIGELRQRAHELGFTRSEVILDPELFYHRYEAALDTASLAGLLESSVVRAGLTFSRPGCEEPDVMALAVENLGPMQSFDSMAAILIMEPPA